MIMNKEKKHFQRVEKEELNKKLKWMIRGNSFKKIKSQKKKKIKNFDKIKEVQVEMTKKFMLIIPRKPNLNYKN